jgi:hypothetical protein
VAPRARLCAMGDELRRSLTGFREDYGIALRPATGTSRDPVMSACGQSHENFTEPSGGSCPTRRYDKIQTEAPPE